MEVINQSLSDPDVILNPCFIEERGVLGKQIGLKIKDSDRASIICILEISCLVCYIRGLHKSD